MKFMTPQHPKSGINLDPHAISRVLARGWIGQPKINGARLQMHISEKGNYICYTRQGREHTREMPEFLVSHILQAFQIEGGDTVIDCEWERFKDKVYIFDVLKLGGAILANETYQDRYQMLELLFKKLPKVRSMNVFLLPIFKTKHQCFKYLSKNDVEGLVFKAWAEIKGWPNNAIIRCRK